MTVDEVRTQFQEDIKILPKQEVGIMYLGRKGKVASLFSQISGFSGEKKALFGKEVNQLKQEIEQFLAQDSAKGSSEYIDIIPVSAQEVEETIGRLSLISRTLYEIQDIFSKMGFQVVEGNQWEDEHYNFDVLNIPEHHPARDMWDTIWLDQTVQGKKTLLRTHTSPVQVRYMEQHEAPYRIISPGTVYRYEATDATHETVFHQVEGFMVDTDISIATFKGVMEEFFAQMFDFPVQTRLRPSYFPFTEPSFEMDIQWKGKWLELFGAGMVHKKVLQHAKNYHEDLQGFAFGIGVERLALLKYQIDDIRFFHSADLRLLKQFK